MSERISGGEFVAVLQESFDRGQDLIFAPTGASMLPMLDGREDKITLSPKPPRLRRYDVALYLRSSTHQLVLHRMVGYDKDGGYIFSGDGQYFYEYGIEDDDILALMTSFTHHGKQRDIHSLSYRLYVRWMMLKKRLRIFAGKLYHKIIGK